MKNKIFIYLEPFTYIRFTKEQILLYNTLSGAKIIVNNHARLHKHLTYLTSNRIIQIDEKLLKNEFFDKFIQNIKKLFCGDLIYLDDKSVPPYICNPKLVIEEDRHVFQNDNYKGNFRVDSLTEYLHEISIFIDAPCEHTCSYCIHALKQFNCCSKFNSDVDEFRKISENLLPQLKYYSIKTVNLITGDIDMINQYSELVYAYLEVAIVVRVICHAKRSLSFSFNNSIINNQGVWLTILLDDTISLKIVQHILNHYHTLNSRLSFNFIVEGENSLIYFSKVYNLIKKHHISIYPTFNGRNKKFIKAQLSLRKKELLESTPSFQDLELNKIININYFGKLFIYPDGTVKTNRSIEQLGNIYKSTLKKLILKEIKSSKSWRLSRSKVSPCKDCLFVDLCPPISDFVQVLNQYDMCEISKYI